MADRDDSRAIILARRKRLIAMALATAGVATLGEGCPQPCLEPAVEPRPPPPEIEPTPDGGLVEPDAAPSGADAAVTEVEEMDDGTGGAEPMPCLSPAPSPPMVCLSVTPPPRPPPPPPTAPPRACLFAPGIDPGDGRRGSS